MTPKCAVGGSGVGSAAECARVVPGDGLVGVAEHERPSTAQPYIPLWRRPDLLLAAIAAQQEATDA